jgi:hypothetical protein
MDKTLPGDEGYDAARLQMFRLVQLSTKTPVVYNLGLTLALIERVGISVRANETRRSCNSKFFKDTQLCGKVTGSRGVAISAGAD